LPGESLNLEWSAADATSCTASGSWAGTRPVSGTETVPNRVDYGEDRSDSVSAVQDFV
jgi:hypothetical protein